MYRLYIKKNTKKEKLNIDLNNVLLDLSQKKYNLKSTILKKNTVNTFSVGSVIKYFISNQGKYVRRSIKGSKILLNFLKTLLKEKFFKNCGRIVIKISGFDYNIITLKKNIKKLFEGNLNYIVFSTKSGFSKKKEKKVKSIKKRLKKKIQNFF